MIVPRSPAPGAQPCTACAAPLAADQRWCVRCGARRPGADPLALLRGVAAADPPAGPDRGGGGSARPAASAAALARRRRAAAPIAMAALVGLFVTAGGGASASLAGLSQAPFTIVLPPVAQLAETPPTPAPHPAADAPLDEPADEAPAEEPAADEPAASDEPATDPGDDGTDDPATDPGTTAKYKHVFLIVLASTDLTALARDATAAPYLAGTLAKSGTLLTGHRAVARGALANRIALVSGQGPTPQTLADCTAPAPVAPADALPDGQTGGDGCTYGFETGTLADQLTGAGRSWRAYVEERHPEHPQGALDDTPPEGAGAGSGAAGCSAGAVPSRRNPFLWFQGLREARDCAQRNASLDQLARDLRDPDTTPALAFVTSDAQAGSVDADAFLERVVPQIQNSLAYADGGLIVVTSDQPPAPAQPAPADPTPAEPDPTQPIPADPSPTQPAPAGPSPAQPTPAQPAPAGPTAAAPPTTTATQPSTATQPDPAPVLTTVAPARAATTAPANPKATTTAASPWPISYPNVGDAAAAGAGATVGALLISASTPAGRTDATPSSHFTLLRTIEEQLGLDPLGYAGAAWARALPDALFDAAQ